MASGAPKRGRQEVEQCGSPYMNWHLASDIKHDAKSNWNKILKVHRNDPIWGTLEREVGSEDTVLGEVLTAELLRNVSSFQ